jgi:Protein of unknown function (DUF3306)
MNESDFLARWLKLKGEVKTPVPAGSSVNLKNLPSIESLTSESDIRMFLQSGVPADLVRAALRHAWTADPTIRNFIGVAETQWDFNDPVAMPGFGPLEPTVSDAPVVRFSAPPETTDGEVFNPEPQNRNPQRDGQLDPVWRNAETPVDVVRSSGGAERELQEGLAPGLVGGAGAPRRHGSALPRPLR